MSLLLLNTISSGNRPAPISHNPLPPFDSNDQYGIVHTSLPPEQIIPPHFSDPLWMRADFNGVNLDTNRWGGNPPFLKGANTTPLSMLMTPMLIMYPVFWQDACLTEHAERGYDDIIIDCEPWNAVANGKSYNPFDILDWCQVLKSWGFRIVLWRGDPMRGLDNMFTTLIQSGLISFYIHGEEVDSKVTSEQYAASLNMINNYLNGAIPIGTHFTADSTRMMGYPIGFPRDTFINNWSLYDGRVHLCLQNSVNAPAGLQGSSMWYARQYVNCGIGDGAQGPGAPNSRVIAFETMSFAQLEGKCTEEYGNLRNWELLCGTRTNPKVLPVSGFGSGCRYPDGSVI